MDIVVDRNDFTKSSIQRQSLDPTQIKKGQILVSVDKFALTSNVVSYASAGESLGYYQFFPAIQEPEKLGRIPVWGFGSVIKSNCEKVAFGEKIFGYFPMSSHLVLNPTRVNAETFVEGAEHRKSLPGAYNEYFFCKSMPGYQEKYEELIALFKPLYFTGWLLSDFFCDNDNFGAQNIIITSASSKTSLSLAHCLKEQFKSSKKKYKVIGMTSSSNVEFSNELGYYDQIVEYDSLEDLDASSTYTIGDMSGNANVIHQLDCRFGENLKYVAAVGNTHWKDSKLDEALKSRAGAKKQFFFAPSQIVKRAKDWGPKEVTKRINESFAVFLEEIYAKKILKLKVVRGEKNVVSEFSTLLQGQVKPNEGVICTLHESAGNL